MNQDTFVHFCSACHNKPTRDIKVSCEDLQMRELALCERCYTVWEWGRSTGEAGNRYWVTKRDDTTETSASPESKP